MRHRLPDRRATRSLRCLWARDHAHSETQQAAYWPTRRRVTANEHPRPRCNEVRDAMDGFTVAGSCLAVRASWDLCRVVGTLRPRVCFNWLLRRVIPTKRTLGVVVTGMHHFLSYGACADRAIEHCTSPRVLGVCKPLHGTQGQLSPSLRFAELTALQIIRIQHPDSRESLVNDFVKRCCYRSQQCLPKNTDLYRYPDHRLSILARIIGITDL